MTAGETAPLVGIFQEVGKLRVDEERGAVRFGQAKSLIMDDLSCF